MNYLISRIVVYTFTIFVSFAAFSQIPNPGFENWTNGNCFFYSYKTPNNWGTINSATCILGQFVVEQTNDAHSGSYAVKLVTRFLAGRTAPGLTVTGTINTTTEMTEGGFTYTSRPDMIAGWYKHAPVNTDTSSVSLVLWRRNGGAYEKVGEANFEAPVAISTYTKFTAPITYFSPSNPDSAKIELLSSYESSGQTGSTFTVDDLQFVFCNISVNISSTDVTTVGGADGTATAIPSGGTAPYNYYWNPSAQTTATIVNLAAGSYCVTVTDGNGCTNSACEIVSAPTCADITCNDGDLCTTDGCDPLTGCTTNPFICNDTDLCTTDGCNPLTGCNNVPIVCDDGIPCTADTCDNGNCSYTPLSCLINLSGAILTELDTPVGKVNVNLSGSSLTDLTTATDGLFSFEVNPNGSYTITPSKNNDSIPNKGVTTLDIVFIQRHILQVQLLGSPYKIIAADVNGSGSVTTLDIVLGRALILGNINTFQNGKLWEFVPEDHVFGDPLNPFPFPKSRYYENKTESQTNQNFIGIKLGDVNGSWNPSTP